MALHCAPSFPSRVAHYRSPLPQLNLSTSPQHFSERSASVIKPLLHTHSHPKKRLLCGSTDRDNSYCIFPLRIYSLAECFSYQQHNSAHINMAVWAYPGGHDMQNRINLDRLGQLYLAFTATWTALILCGIAFLIRNRKLPFLRIRRLPLGILAVCTLHVYWCLCMLAYVLNGYFACSMEYWVMSTYLPIGIALYQASSTQLQHIASLQQGIACSKPLHVQQKPRGSVHGWRRLVAKWNSYTVTQRAMTCIQVGIVAQVSCFSHHSIAQLH